MYALLQLNSLPDFPLYPEYEDEILCSLVRAMTSFSKSSKLNLDNNTRNRDYSQNDNYLL